MRQDNSIHYFYTLLVLLLGLIIGAMTVYILTELFRVTTPNPVPISQPSEQRGAREQLDSPRPVSRGSTAPESESLKDEDQQTHCCCGMQPLEQSH